MTATTAPDPHSLRVARDFLARVAGDYPVVQALLYGSRARGDARPDSDLDLAFILTGPKGRAIEIGSEIFSAGYDVSLANNIFISALPIWEEDWRDPDRHSNPWLIRNIQREGVPI